MSIYTHNWESVMNLNNRMLNIDKKTLKKNKKRKKLKKQIKNRFFHKKPFFIEIKNQKIKNGFLYNTSWGWGTGLNYFSLDTPCIIPNMYVLCKKQSRWVRCA